ncbi:MAG: dihydroorotate dehydrogenase [Candidatus Omnitrophica bacterium]|nr:dihydroorotate dehydrogenase [Candidatus Omnitrophota bacterium]
MNLSVCLGKLRLKNPVTVASGTFGYAVEFKDLVKLNSLGAIITKTITPQPKPGNPPPRLAETSSGMLNAIGLQNEGLDNFIRVKLPELKKLGTTLIVSISAPGAEEFLSSVRRLEDAGVEAVELNLSCPNIKYGSTMFAQDPQATFDVVRTVCKAVSLTVIAKLSPNVTDIAAIALAAERAGAGAVSLVNTFLGMAIDVESGKTKLANGTGGLSGPAIKPVAVRMVNDVARAVKIPVLGMGGIMNTEDALEFMLAGATAISVGTANFVNPRASLDIIEGIRAYCVRKKINDINRIIGKVKR